MKNARRIARCMRATQFVVELIGLVALFMLLLTGLFFDPMCKMLDWTGC